MPHRFHDGAWDEEDTQFHVYREIENPGLGTLRTDLFGPYWPGFDPFKLSPDDSVYPLSWRPVIARGFDPPFRADPGQQLPGVDLPDPIEPDYADYVLSLNALGTSYIRRYRPGNPVANLGQWYGELHDLPRLPIFLKERTKHFRDLGSEYLNIEFGWKPFVKDLIQVYRTQQTIKDRLEKLIRDNGLKVKRRSKRDTDSVSSVLGEGNLTQPFGRLDDFSIGGLPYTELEGLKVQGPYGTGYPDEAVSGSCPFRVETGTDTVTWFVGTFRYYVPDIGSDRWTEKAKANLFGLTPTPSVLYELYPWSWLVDWFSNVGDIVSNLSANPVDNEFLTDAYVMQTIVERLRVTADPSWDASSFYAPNYGANLSISAGSDHLDYSLLKVNKLRRQASPFGFGLKSLDFSLRQLAILAALGISQGRMPKYFQVLGLGKYF
jgi:hypothetical protein